MQLKGKKVVMELSEGLLVLYEDMWSNKAVLKIPLEVSFLRLLYISKTHTLSVSPSRFVSFHDLPNRAAELQRESRGNHLSHRPVLQHLARVPVRRERCAGVV